MVSTVTGLYPSTEALLNVCSFSVGVTVNDSIVGESPLILTLILA